MPTRPPLTCTPPVTAPDSGSRCVSTSPFSRPSGRRSTRRSPRSPARESAGSCEKSAATARPSRSKRAAHRHPAAIHPQLPHEAVDPAHRRRHGEGPRQHVDDHLAPFHLEAAADVERVDLIAPIARGETQQPAADQHPVDPDVAAARLCGPAPDGADRKHPGPGGVLRHIQLRTGHRQVGQFAPSAQEPDQVVTGLHPIGPHRG